jgi:uncharacterized membrane protein YccC
MKRFAGEFSGLVWTLAGTALVLITLSGKTRTMGLWISATALVLNLVALAISNGEEE